MKQKDSETETVSRFIHICKDRYYLYKYKVCVLSETHRSGCEVEVGESVQLEEECVHQLLNFHVCWVLLLLSLLLN